jgi:hypothetical protein
MAEQQRQMQAKMAEQEAQMFTYMHACFQAQALGQPIPTPPPGLFEPVAISPAHTPPLHTAVSLLTC